VQGTALRLGSFTLSAPHAATAELNGDGAVAMIRPENVRLREHGSDGENLVPGMVEEVVYLGFHQELRVRLASGALVRADLPNDGTAVEYAQGDAVAVWLPPDCLRVLES